jgi:hypothetical protein
MRFLSNTAIISKTPIVTTCLLEWANLSQLWRMWTTWTSDGQSIVGWCSVQVALWLWWNFYRVMLPDQRLPRYGTMVGITTNACVILTVVYFRYFH